MRKIQLLFALMAVLTASCDKDSLENDNKETYSDMEITEFTYAEIPAEGGTVTPKVAYRYKATVSGKSEERTADAQTVFTLTTCDNIKYTIDKNTGAITAPANTSVKPVSFNVDFNVSKETATSKKTVVVIQTGTKDGIVATKTVQLPIVLAPHTCVYPAYDTLNWNYKFDKKEEYSYTTTRTDGKVDRDYLDQIADRSNGVPAVKIGISPERVSTKGVNINISGGDLVSINTYRSGKVDTVVVAKAVYTTSTKYEFEPEQYYDNNGQQHTTDDPSQAPSSSVEGNTWKIHAIGYGFYTKTSHTLTATADGNTVNLTVNQQHNYPVGKKDQYLVFKEHKIYTQRDNWPNYEDYPPGSKPKWAKDEFGDYMNLDDTRDLHPDTNRYINFYLYIRFDHMGGGRIYLSGATGKDHLVQHYGGHHIMRGGVKITGTADVKLKDGSTRKITHTSEWIQPEKGQYTNGAPFTVLVPLIEDAAEDFVWNFKFEFPLSITDKHTLSFDINLKDNSNFFEYDWSFKDFTFKDCLYTQEQYTKDASMYGFFIGSTGATDKENLGDIINGVRR